MRITPADAGKTLRVAQFRRLSRDHPRGCGENDILPSTFKQSLGSPPRMRGKRESFIGGSVKGRITPADAGKTKVLALAFDFLEDHPRGCGENLQR